MVVLLENTKINGGNDEIAWGPSTNKQYNLSNMYGFMKKRNLHGCEVVWFQGRIPRHAFIAWMALLRGLKTLRKLKTWGVVGSNLCVHCWRSQETEDHLLFTAQWLDSYGGGLNRKWVMLAT